MLSAITASIGVGAGHHAEGGERKRGGVGDAERCDRLEQHAHAGHDQEQAQYEQQMINTIQNVVDPQAQITQSVHAARAILVDDEGGCERP
jgi:hypothetical protein